MDQYFRVRDGLDAGIGRGALAGPRFERPYWGIRHAAGQVVDPALAFAPRLPDRAFFFGPTAARILGLPLPHRLAADDRVHIAVRAGERRVDAAGVGRHHVRITDADIGIIVGLPVTKAARVFCDLGNVLRLRELVALGDRILWRHDPLATRSELWAALRRFHGRRGVRTIRAAIPLLSGRADSAPESEIRVAVLEAGLTAPEVNRPVRDARGRVIASPDLSWPVTRLALEYEGDHHRVNRDQWHHDLERFSALQEAGWTMIRASAADYRDPGPLTRRLARILHHRERS